MPGKQEKAGRPSKYIFAALRGAKSTGKAENAVHIALTFDDGPNTEITPRVLDILEENGVRASFFLIADAITPESAKVARRAWKMGCEINNHSKTHDFMDRMAPETIREEIADCTQKIVEITGVPPRFFRPPYIAVNQTLYDNVDLTFICGVGCEDWVPQVTARQRIDRILASAKDGDILLLHDMPGNENTVEAIRTVIPELKKRGFEFVTCGELFACKGVTPERGKIYSNVWD